MFDHQLSVWDQIARWRSVRGALRLYAGERLSDTFTGDTDEELFVLVSVVKIVEIQKG